MTQEHPQQRFGYCTECQSRVHVKRDDRLKIGCQCDDRDIRVKRATPMEWQL